jgi:hypothetical protein
MVPDVVRLIVRNFALVDLTNFFLKVRCRQRAGKEGLPSPGNTEVPVRHQLAASLRSSARQAMSWGSLERGNSGTYVVDHVVLPIDE